MKLLKKYLFLALAYTTTTFLFIACSKDSNVPGGSSYPKQVTIEYKATSSTGITDFKYIHYTNETDGISEVENGKLPFSKKITLTVNEDTSLELGVSLFDGTSGSLTVEILVDGKLVGTKTNTSAGGTVSGNITYNFE